MILSVLQVESFWDELTKIASTEGFYAGRSEDPDVPATEKEKDLEASDRKSCVECGCPVPKDAQHCPKCGARQVIPNRVPKSPRDKRDAKRRSEEKRWEEENLEGAVGGEAAAEAASADVTKTAFVLKKIKANLSPTQWGMAKRVVGAGSIATGLYGGVRINRALYGNAKTGKPGMVPRQPKQQQQGMVRTAAVRRTINPIHNIRSGRKRRRIRQHLRKIRGE